MNPAPLQIGKLQLDNPIIQGPLAGYSCAALRTIAWRYGPPGLCYTEMISAKTLLQAKQHIPKRLTYRHPKEKLLCWQLAGNDPQELAQACQFAQDHGADAIDLNCGCPVKKIRRKGYGSRLLSEPQQLQKILMAMRKVCHVPIIVKIRVGDPINDSDSILIANIVEQTGCDAIAVHGRHWQDKYDVECRYQQIADIVKAVSIPVIGNGDIACSQSYNKMIKKTGCHGMMISRASVGQPWLFQQLHNSNIANPTINQIKNMLWQHIQLLCLVEPERIALLQARKLIKYYARQHFNRAEIFNAICECKTLKQAQQIFKANKHEIS